MKIVLLKYTYYSRKSFLLKKKLFNGLSLLQCRESDDIWCEGYYKICNPGYNIVQRTYGNPKSICHIPIASTFMPNIPKKTYDMFLWRNRLVSCMICDNICT